MNVADGSEQTNISNSPAYEADPEFGSGAPTEPPEQDTTPPTITVPEYITEEATSADDAIVSFEEVTAEDNVDFLSDNYLKWDRLGFEPTM